MKFCNECGTKYLTAVCPQCQSDNYSTNPIHKQAKNNYIIKGMFFIVLAMSLTINVLVYYKYSTDKRVLNNLENENKIIKREKAKLENSLRTKEKTANQLLKKVQELRQYENFYMMNHNKISNTKQTSNRQIHVKNMPSQIYNAPKKHVAPKITGKKTYMSNPMKNIPQYNYMRIESDFTKEKVNGLWKAISGGIYGRTNQYTIQNPVCKGKYNSDLMINQECYVKVGLLGDKLYLSKSNAGEFYGYNDKRDHYMIECKYKEDNGYLHDCRVVMSKYKAL